jgi:hypothetical protein
MGTPSTSGNPAGSAAQTGSKSFPAGSDPSDIAHVSGLPDGTPQMVGSPVQPEIRQVTPAAQMGEGYREADPGSDPW